MIYLEINGERYENFLNISVTREYDAVPSGFSFESTTDPNDSTSFPILLGAACRILIDDYCIINGFVDELSINHSINTHNISINGSSKLADLVDSTMDATFNFTFKKGQYLKEALETIIAKTMVDVSVVDDVNLIFTEEQQIEGTVGTSVWELMCKLAIKFNCLLGETGNGDVFLTRGGGDRIDWPLIKRVNSIDNNLLSSSINFSNRARFNRYAIISQGDILSYQALDGNNAQVPPASAVGDSLDPEIRPTRFSCTMAEQASDRETCVRRAAWQANTSRVDAQNYECGYQGYKTPQGYVIEPGYIVHVIDDYVGVNGDMLIKSVSYSYNRNGGSIVTMALVLPDSYTLAATMDKPDESGNNYEKILRRDNKT